MNVSRLRRYAIAAPALLLPVIADTTEYQLQPAGSRLGFGATFQGAAFSGHFERWDAKITYDPAQPAACRFEVDVDTASAKTGDSDRDGALPGADFFDVAQYPRAHFVTTGCHPAGGKMIADGLLTLRGTTRPVSLTVDFKPQGRDATLDVAGTLKRLDFGVGGGDYADTSVIGAEVKVSAHLQLVAK